MNDKDRELVEQVLHAAGTAGQEGFGYMVRYQMISGAATVLTAALILAAIVYLAKRLSKWDAKDEAAIAKGVAILILGIGFILSAVFIGGGITDLFAPEGAAIHSVIH